MNVTLKPELEQLIVDEVRAGRSTGPEYAPAEIDRMIAEGLNEIERGETIDGEEAFRQLRAYSARAVTNARERV